MRYLKLSELPGQLQSLFKGHNARFLFWVRMIKDDERYYAKDSHGTDVFAFRDGRWTRINKD